MTISRRSSILVSLAALVGLSCGGLAFATEVLPASSGAVLGGSNGGYLEDGAEVVVLPGATTPLRSGDVVTTIAGARLDTWPVTGGHVPDPSTPGESPVAYASVIRGSETMILTVPLGAYPLANFLITNAGTLAFVVLLFVVALYVFARRPREAAAVGLLLMAVGAVGSTPSYLAGIDPLAFSRGTYLASLVATVLVYNLLWTGGLHFAMTFPRPHPLVATRPALPWMVYPVVYAGLALSAVAALLVDPGGLAVIGLFLLLGTIIALGVMAAMGAFMLSAWRRSVGEERRMLRGIFLAAALALGAGLVLSFVPEIFLGEPLVPWSFSAVVGLPFVFALAAAVLRQRAFDIDVVVDRTLVYGGLTLAVLGIYVAAVTILGALLLDSADYAVALLGTAVAALAALPVRDVLQRIVDRALYGDRRDPVRAMRRLGDRLTWTVAPEAIPEVIVTTVADSLRLPYVALEMGGPDDRRVAAERGSAPDTDRLIAIPLVARSMEVGRLLLATRGPDEPLSPADRRLLDDLARQAGPAVDTLALNVALRRSRERIVLAVEEERRRLRRDLHDGLGPTLAAIGLRAEATRRRLADDPDEARRMLDQVRDDVQAAVADVRRLVDGLRPPALDELGLAGAIAQQADRLGVADPDFVVDAPQPLGDLPAAVEVAAYRIAVEAMTNVVRHSGARRCRVRLVTDAIGTARRLSLEVSDDGSGFVSEPRGGVGLESMRERAAEVGGDVRVEGAPSGGTRVQAWLPLGST